MSIYFLNDARNLINFAYFLCYIEKKYACPYAAGAWKGVGIKMAASDIVIHQGEKEEKYQLYVEDYVMSYLRNYGAGESGKIFFYGKREQKNKKYYIYGAGCQRELPCFAQYEPLDEIICRLTTDMPVFLMKNEKETYELSGYYIFYQSNEAMQNYMIEQRKTAEDREKTQSRAGAQTERKQPGAQGIVRPQNIVRPQSITRPQNRNRPQPDSRKQSGGAEARQGAAKGGRVKSGNAEGNFKGGLMAMQLAAIFIVLIAIVINSTNSYTKLEELNQAAVEVFFAMENEEAADKGNLSQEADGAAESGKETEDQREETEGTASRQQEKPEGTAFQQQEETDGTASQKESTTAAETEGTVLRLEDLDIKFEEENQAAKQEEAGGGAENEKSEAGRQPESEAEDKGDGGKTAEEQENVEEQAGAAEQEDAIEQADAQTEEKGQSEQAFARNFAEYYKIEKGDTLYKISIKIYGDTGKVEEICELNKIKDPDNIKYGQKILLP